MWVCIHMYTHTFARATRDISVEWMCACINGQVHTKAVYGMATISRLLKILGLFRRI